MPNLSKEAKTLLKRASQSSDGVIERQSERMGSNIYIVKVEDKNFVEEGNSRSKAIWREAVEELLENGFICVTETDRGWERFEVTQAGYDFADENL